MLSVDYLNQSIDWWHSPILGSTETFDHEGYLTSQILNLNSTIGLNDYFNFSINQIWGIRTMDYQSQESVHHRSEDSTSDFDNAHGGLLGDTRINLKYLITNAGRQKGSRVFIGSGISIPSKNKLTASPFLHDENGEHAPHRHFSLSDGALKYLFELQLFYKQNTFPVFYGLSFNIDYPLKENEYGYLPSNLYNLNFLFFTKKFSLINSPIGLNINYIKTSKAYWNEVYAKNSDSEIIAPGISFTFNSKKKSSYGFKLSKEIVKNISFGDNALDQRVNSWTITLSIRKVLDYTIPFLYY